MGVFVEYAGVLAAMSLLTATLGGSYGQSVVAVFSTNGAGVAAVVSAARSQHAPAAGAKAAYKRAPYAKPALKYLYAVGWIGGVRNRGQCGLVTIGQDAAREQAEREVRGNAKLLAQLRKRGIGTRTAAAALVKGVVSACN